MLQADIGDDSELGTAEEDRFFCVVDTRGIKHDTTRRAPPNAPSGIEVGHVQYER